MKWVLPSTYKNPEYPFVPYEEQRTGTIKHHKVVIIGAGPAGLTAAIDLAERGISSVVFSKEKSVSVGSRALCFAKKSLETVSRLNPEIAEKMIRKGIVWNVGKVFNQKELVYQFDLLPEEGHKIPAFINLQQYHFEEPLVDYAMAHPLIDLRWQNTALFKNQDNEKVSLEIETPEGTYKTTAEYLIACDGVRSTTREAMNIPFEGELFDENFLIADVVMENDFPTERWFWFDPPFNKNQSALLHKEPDGVWRIDLQLGWKDVDKKKELDPERIKERLRQMLGPDCKFELEWTSIYNFKCMRIEKLRHDRVFFAGDSAHQVSPFGARGANGSIQDTDNLIWKLARVIKGDSPESLLNTYNEERSPAADENILHSSNSTDFISPKSDISLQFRNKVLDLAKHNSFARTLINSGRLSQPYRYVNSSLVTQDSDLDWDCQLQPGCSIKDAIIHNGFLIDILTKDFTLIYFGDKIVGNGILSNTIYANESDTDLIQKYDLKPGSWYLIRPDHYIAARGRNFNLNRIEGAVLKSVGQIISKETTEKVPDKFRPFRNDEKYNALIDAHEGLNSEDSNDLNIKILLLLLEKVDAKHIHDVIDKIKSNKS